MKHQTIHQHPLLAPLSAQAREQVWHGFRAKYPNKKWANTFFGLWLAWTLWFMILAQLLEPYAGGLGGRLLLHLLLTLGVGVVGGIVVIGHFMLPRRRREFIAYLEGKTLNQVRRDLGLPELERSKPDPDPGAR